MKYRKLKNTEVTAYRKNLRVSPLKLNLVAGMIRGLSCSQAANALVFSHKRIAVDVKKLLDSAISNAENNHNMNIDALYVSEVLVGKGMVMKRMRPRAKGRGNRILKPFSHIRIILDQREEATNGAKG